MVDQKRFAEVLTLAKSHPDTTDFAALYAAGQAAEGLLKYRDAYHYYRRCPATDSARTELLVALARTAGAIGQTDEAEHYLLQLRARDTTDSMTGRATPSVRWRITRSCWPAIRRTRC